MYRKNSRRSVKSGKWKPVGSIWCLLFLLCSCARFSDSTGRSTPTTTAPRSVVVTATSTPLSDTDLVARLVKKMSLDQKLGQMVISEFHGATIDSDLQQMIQTSFISGVLIENKNGNALNSKQLSALNQSMQEKTHIPLFISTDYEGGIVNELRQITGERPSEATIGASNDPQVAYKAGHDAASDLSALGLNVNFMPIVDVLTNPNNPGLPQRTFGSDATLVTNMGRAYLKGLTDGDIIGCLKHFPGLGSANLDPHLALPTMDRSLDMLNAVDLVPYRTMINEGIVPMVMVTHILNPQLDPTLPTSLSPNVVTNLLRNTLHFQGVIISDTLWMGGVSNTYPLPKAAVMAVKAGTDLLLGPRSLLETQTMLASLKQAVIGGEISQNSIDTAVNRILALKLKYHILSHAEILQLLKESWEGETHR